jgi:hypothetical protein
MKKYIHEKRNQLKSALFHAGQTTRQPELFETILDENGKLVDPSDIKRKNELVGAGLQYTMSIVDYYCTHKKSELQLVDGSAKRMKIPTLTWEMAIDIATNNIPGQRKRAEAAILNLRAMQRPVFIYDFDYDTNGISYSMIPFIIDLTFEDGTKARTTSAAKIARLIKNGKTPNQDQPFKIIKYIDILFAKPLYEGFFRKSNYYSFPTGMYAQFFKIVNDGKKSLQKEMQVKDDLIDSEPYIDFYCRFARYIQLHNNLNKQTKQSNILKTLEELFADVYDCLIEWKNGKSYIRDQKKALKLIASAVAAMLDLDGFYAYPAFEGHKDGKIKIGLYRDRNEALEAIAEWRKKQVK